MNISIRDHEEHELEKYFKAQENCIDQIYYRLSDKQRHDTMVCEMCDKFQEKLTEPNHHIQFLEDEIYKARNMAKSVPQLLREAAQALERQTANVGPSENPSSGLSTTPPDRSGGTRAEVLRLFAPYSNPRSRVPRRPSTAGPSAKKSKSVSYTHHFFCLSKRKECEVPSPSVKNKLERAGIGEKRITIPDKYCTPQEFSDHLFQHFPMLKDCGGFQLLRSRGSTRSKKLETIPCPDDGYSPEYLLTWIKEAIGTEGEYEAMAEGPEEEEFRGWTKGPAHSSSRSTVASIVRLFRNENRIMEFEAEAGFNLCKVRRCGRNIIGQRATVTVPGQRGANITMCAAISNDGVLCHIPTIGPYNTECLITFLDALKEILIPPEERGLLRPGMTLYVIIWDNVAFHHSRLVNEWFAAQPRIMMQFLPAYSPFLNPVEEFFSAWR
ncbi:hypothetical protein ROHU_008251 [Labeo rohita]|uniref:Ig-like domain-containing protein n=1 Tax=Labeo rohita TaxID=84645 RepID=A0A498MBN9_LABRO|nr:hypothetical protein ROHU_008251 [Labeo rohita]